MNAVIDLTEVEDQLVNCKPGDTYTLTFTVDAKTPDELTGTATEVEHLGGEEESYDEDQSAGEETPEETMPKGRMAGKKMPKAILMISK